VGRYTLSRTPTDEGVGNRTIHCLESLTLIDLGISRLAAHRSISPVVDQSGFDLDVSEPSRCMC